MPVHTHHIHPGEILGSLGEGESRQGKEQDESGGIVIGKYRRLK